MDRRKNAILLFIIIVFIGAFLSYLGFNRSFFTYSTETDFLGGFLPEAKRVLAGEPLLLSFHPPFYSIVLAGVQSVVGNWFYAGIVISILSCLAVIVANFFLFENSCGRYAGWTVLAGFLLSAPFLTYSCFATSDIFFLALYSCCLLLAYYAYTNESKILWSVCGFVCGLTLLTRSNGITILAFLLLPWLTIIPVERRLKNFLALLSGLSIPIIIWISYAKITGGPLMPEGNYINIALTYFSHGSDRISGDARAPLEKEFTSLWQVLSYNPLHIVKTYLFDLFHNKALSAGELFPFPINFIVGVSFVVMLFKKPADNFWYYILILTALQLLLVNFKAYETRYYFFLLPVLSAPVGVFINKLFQRFSKVPLGYAVASLLMFGVIFLDFNSSKIAFSALHLDDKELSEAITKISKVIKNDKHIIIFSRKEHIAYYLGVKHRYIPLVNNVQELEKYFKNNKDDSHIYMYYGQAEKSSRPQFMSLSNSKNTAFEVVSRSDIDDSWRLYRYVGK